MILIFLSSKRVTAQELNGQQAAGSERVLEPHWQVWDPRSIKTTPRAAKHPHVKASPSPAAKGAFKTTPLDGCTVC